MSIVNTHTLVRGTKSIEVSLKSGHTLEDLVRRMNSWEAQIQGSEVIRFPGSASDGYYVLADIVSQTEGCGACGDWTVSTSTEEPSCPGKC